MQADILAVGVSFEELLRAAVANGGVKVPPEGVEAWIASVLEQRRRTTETAFESRLSNGWWLRIRSEEHTSELQSLMRISYAVFCLKKKKKKHKTIHKKYTS